jgi:DNA-binding transcriptional LysR family regulator
MELRHLRYFVAVAEEQNFSRAAARLYVSQPPLSRQIRDLERELGVSLFERTPKAVKLTEAGSVFLLEARAALQRVDEAIETVKAAASGKKGRVRVGYAASPTAEALPRALKAFKQSNPHVAVHLRTMNSPAMLKGLQEGSLDVALVVPLSPHDFAGLVVEEIGSYSARVATHPKHKFARSRNVRLSDVAKEPLIAFTRREHHEHHLFLERIFSPLHKLPVISEEVDSATSLIAAVEAGRGITVVFETLSLLAGGRLTMRPITPDPGRFPIGIAYRKSGASAATMAFVEATLRSKLRN